METAGLVIGVVGLAGLFKSCLEALDKLQSHRAFGNDPDVLDTRSNATKARFERLGPGVGIKRGQLMHARRPALDDKVLSDAVAKLLHVIVEAICNPGNRDLHTLRNVTHESRKKENDIEFFVMEEDFADAERVTEVAQFSIADLGGPPPRTTIAQQPVQTPRAQTNQLYRRTPP
ncbi:unnamed protein product [Clonostachys rhizophaga]|uniref:Prion-inhibition and propagation HeLo domain-containing protein n=1 Tax=Clonostachys rhizophaga TaxID=160324 RepID=A0A9N9VMQ4_9HYPO|nr:unnamed protein product [Clonostachys rhizophaga]